VFLRRILVIWKRKEFLQEVMRLNPMTKEKVPVYAGNFVVADYGSGMVMAVPAHDQRDYDFAKKYELEIIEVVKGGDVKKQFYVGTGELVNSEKFNGLEK